MQRFDCSRLPSTTPKSSPPLDQHFVGAYPAHLRVSRAKCGVCSIQFPDLPTFTPFTFYQRLVTKVSPFTQVSNSSVILRASAIALTLALLVAIVVCSLTSSPNMSELPFIPTWLGTWADRNGNFRNFPVFAALAALLFFVFSAFRLQTATCNLPTSKQSLGLFVSRLLVLRRAALCFCAAALLGASLEVAQLLFLPNRHFDWADIGWLTAGAFVGAFLSAACCGRSHNRQYFHYPKLHHDSFS